MTYRVITIGNAVIDAFLSLDDANDSCSLDRENSKLCVSYGEKILLSGCDFMLGGNACNVAVGLSRLGVNAGLLAEIGADEFAQKILNGLRKEEVGVDYLVRGDGQTSFSIGLNFQRERTLFIEHREREHNFQLQQVQPEYFYLTSLGDKWEHVYKAVYEKLQTTPAIKLAFNPGSVQIKAGLTSFAYLLPHTDILFLNKEEAQRLLGSEEEIPELLRAFKKLGVRIVVLTDGEKGSSAIMESGEIVSQGIIACSVVERTGAGDAYATGFLAAILKGKSLPVALVWGAKNSASVIEQVGSQKGLVTEQQITQ